MAPRDCFDRKKHVVQSFTVNRLRPSCLQGRVHLASLEKGWHGFIGCGILPSNIQPMSPFEATRKACCLAAPCSSQLKQSATQTPVGVSDSSFNLDRCVEGYIRHPSCSWRGRFVCSDFVGLVGGLRHGRSWNSSASTGDRKSVV